MEKLVKGQRFMVPIIPLLLIPYLNFLHDKKLARKILIFAVPFLFLCNCGIQYKHHQFVEKEKLLSQILQEKIKDVDIVICNSDTDELLNPYFIKVKLVDLSELNKDDLNLLAENNKISFVFVELKRGKNYEEKSQWIKYFTKKGFMVSYKSKEPAPIIVMSE